MVDDMKIKETLQNYKRVLKISSKPSKEDFSTTAKICAIGIAIMGILGFLLYIISVLTGL